MLLSMLVYFHLPFWLVFHFPFSVRSLIYTLIYLLFTLISLTTTPPVWYHMRGTWMGWGLGWGGVGSHMVWRIYWICTRIYARKWCNVPTRFPIPDSGSQLYPFTARDWWVQLRRSYVSTILEPRLRFDRLSHPLRAKRVRPFYLPWFD